MEKYIIDLLYKYDCVIVPEFGGFIAQHKSAVFHPMDYTFNPPKKVIGFNSDLIHSDGLLAHHVAKREALSYDDAVQKINEQVVTWKKELELGKSILLDGLGTFQIKHQHIEFNPSEDLNFSFDTFGMQAVQGHYILRKSEEEIPSEEKTVNSWVSYAAAVGFSVMVGASAFFANDNLIQPQLSSVLPLLHNQSIAEVSHTKNYQAAAPEIVIQESNLSVVKSIEDNDNLTKTENEASESIDTKEEIDLSIKPFQVIGGSFKVYSKAMQHQAYLKQKGYDRAVIVGKVGNFYMVAFDTFEDEGSARLYKQELEKKGFDVFMRP